MASTIGTTDFLQQIEALNMAAMSAVSSEAKEKIKQDYMTLRQGMPQAQWQIYSQNLMSQGGRIMAKNGKQINIPKGKDGLPLGFGDDVVMTDAELEARQYREQEISGALRRLGSEDITPDVRQHAKDWLQEVKNGTLGPTGKVWQESYRAVIEDLRQRDLQETRDQNEREDYNAGSLVIKLLRESFKRLRKGTEKNKKSTEKNKNNKTEINQTLDKMEEQDSSTLKVLNEFAKNRKATDAVNNILQQREGSEKALSLRKEILDGPNLSRNELVDFIIDKKLLQDRDLQQEGGEMAMPPEYTEDVPVDTYPNMTPEEEAMPIASDEQMQEDYVDYVAAEVLTQDEQDYLNTVLDTDPELEGILDKVITYAAEFTGEGEVEGPGTGISDSIPARLSDGEFVITEKATDEIGADNLQTMMDEAERAADGGKVAYALGGAVGNPMLGGAVKPLTPETPLANEKVSMYGNLRQQEEMKKQMMYANRMPSIIGR